MFYTDECELNKIIDVIEDYNEKYEMGNTIVKNRNLFFDILGRKYPNDEGLSSINLAKKYKIDLTGIDIDDFSILPEYQCPVKVNNCIYINSNGKNGIRVLLSDGGIESFSCFLELYEIEYDERLLDHDELGYVLDENSELYEENDLSMWY